MAKKEQLNSGLSLKLFSDTPIKASICALRIIEKKKTVSGPSWNSEPMFNMIVRNCHQDRFHQTSQKNIKMVFLAD